MGGFFTLKRYRCISPAKNVAFLIILSKDVEVIFVSLTILQFNFV